MRFKRTLILLLVCSLLTGCSGGSDPSIDGIDPLPESTVSTIPSTEAVIEPEDTTASVSQADTTALPEETTAATQEPSEETLAADSTFEIHYIDVGQADASLILCDDAAMLIDGGNAEDSNLIYSYLEKHGVDYLDYLICTHGHEDHVGGLSGALHYADVGTAYCSVTAYDSNAFDNFVEALDRRGKQITVPAPGDTFALGSANVEILGPLSPTDEPNNTSIALRIEYGDTSFLFAGDAETEEENEILDAGYDISCDVMQVNHHGSDTSTGYRWLREAAPEYAVISCGADNSYGHPTENCLSKLRDADVTLFRTDLQGDIICTSDGTEISFTVERNAEANTLSGAGAGGNHLDETEPETTETATEAAAEPAASVTYIVNVNTYKFHVLSCSSVDQMAEKNKREVTSTREELISQGYSPCGRCKP